MTCNIKIQNQIERMLVIGIFSHSSFSSLNERNVEVDFPAHMALLHQRWIY